MAIKTYPFDTPSNYNYDPSKIEVTGGVAKLIGTFIPYAHYHLNESSGTNVPDSSGNSRDATTINMEDGDWIAGKLNNCLQFDGINEYVNCGDIAGFERNQSFSIEAWINTSSSAQQMIMSRMYDLSPYQGWQVMKLNTNQISITLVNNASTNILNVRGTTLVNSGTWRHIIVTYDGSSDASGINIYVDGNLETMVTVTNTLSDTIITAANCNIGARSGSLTWNGELDEPVIYDFELTPSQVTFRWNGGTGIESDFSTYSTDKPTIAPTTLFDPAVVITWDSFLETLGGANQGNIGYNLRKDQVDAYVQYHLNEAIGADVEDSSGNGRNGLRVNMEDVDWVAGKLNNCLQFDGVNEYVNCGDIANFERTNTFNLECWIKTTTTSLQIIISRLDTTLNRGWQLYINSGAIGLGLISSPTNQISVLTVNDTFADGAWHHIIATYDGSSDVSGVHIYIDNNDETLTIYSNNLTATMLTTKDCLIGRSDGGSYFNGLIDEVVIYEPELTSLQVHSRYNYGSGTEELPFYNYYWNGSAWVKGGDTDHYNSATFVNTNIDSFDVTPDKIGFVAYFLSDGSQQVELDEIQIDYATSLPPIVDAGSNKVCGQHSSIALFSDCSFSDPDGTVDHAYYKVDGEVTVWTEILQAAYPTLLEAVQAFTYIFNNLGAKTCRLKVKDDAGLTDEDSLIVTVTEAIITFNIKDEEGIDIPQLLFRSNTGEAWFLKDSPFTQGYACGSCTITISKSGFYSHTQVINVSEDATIDIELRRLEVPETEVIDLKTETEKSYNYYDSNVLAVTDVYQTLTPDFDAEVVYFKNLGIKPLRLMIITTANITKTILLVASSVLKGRFNLKSIKYKTISPGDTSSLRYVIAGFKSQLQG